jgi:Secretion system C-terminal sorting domain
MLCFLSLGVVWSQTASSNTKPIASLQGGRSVAQNPKIKVYPNPATEYIKLSQIVDVRKIKILSLIGSPMKLYDVVETEEKYDVSDLPNGLYLVQLLDSNNKVITTQRLNKR